MSKRLPFHVPDDNGPPIWRTLQEKADPTRRERASVEEKGVILETSVVGRRRFLAVSGATAAAVGLSGCLRRPAEQILPYSRAPEYTLPGIALHFATATHHHGETVGLLVESHEGRPTKIEGNPDHSGSLGATDAQIQAMTLELYDAERTGKPRQRNNDASWAAFERFWDTRARTFDASQGQGLAILAEPSDSPSFARIRAALTERYPNARIYTYSSVSQSNARQGARLAFGEPLATRIDFERANTVLALDCDFLGDEAGAIRNQRRFANARRLRNAQGQMNRLYVVEGTLSITGMNADNRLRLSPSKIDGYLRALAARIPNLAPTVAASVRGASPPDGVPSGWIDAVVSELVRNAQQRRPSVVCVGWRQPPHVHALAHAINMALRTPGAQTVQYFTPTDAEERPELEGLRELVTAMRGRQVNTLVILGGNPVYDAPADLRFEEALSHVSLSIHLASHDDETSEHCTWHLPRAHFLESWGDHRALDGTFTVQQPLIAPLRTGRSDLEILAIVAGVRPWRGHQVVRATVRELVGPPQLERAWREGLHRGIVPGIATSGAREPQLRDAELGRALQQRPAGTRGWEAVFIPSYQVHDGRYANLAWLLELPDPITKIVWDNAAYLSPQSAARLEVATGDMLEISRQGRRSIQIPAFVLPGHPDEVVTLPLGFGRTRAGRYGNGVGVDVSPLRGSDAFGFATGVQVAKAGGTHTIVQTQDHHSMQGRPLAIDATIEEYRRQPDFPLWGNEERFGTASPSVRPLWPEVDYRGPEPNPAGGLSYKLWPEPRETPSGAPPRYKWGLVFDLATCTGCSACVIACQAENNSPVVGKAQVARGREMHWMRVDRYFVGEDESEPRIALQPVACQHCEEAPCENVCPVNATSHSPEGLNDMTYNRCIGTRYCMNNCPYKVRRFNFLDWHGEVPETERMRFNPNVTVRMRGVMEKCTYCVQRIQAARIHARTETVVDEEGRIAHRAIEADVAAGRARTVGELIEGERRIQHGEVVPACAQACPSSAIVFGDLNDAPEGEREEWRVHEWSRVDRGYKLLASIGTQPRTTYLGKIRNPNPELV